jgi:hypothetical protein
MNDVIYPRSPRETMCGWMHLPRYIDKIRLHLAGKLHKDYQENFGKGFDGKWLQAAGLTHDQFVKVVKGTVTDGEVADWVLRNVKRSDDEKRRDADAPQTTQRTGRTQSPYRHPNLCGFHRRRREAHRTVGFPWWNGLFHSPKVYTDSYTLGLKESNCFSPRIALTRH